MNRTSLSVIFISTVLLFSCEQKQAPPPQPTPVNLDTVKARPVVYYDRYPSTTVALSQVNLLAQVQGYITGIFFKEGAHVKKGEKLYDIDSRIYQNNYDQALANLKVAEGTLTQSQQDADRYTYLNSEKAVAKQLYDHAIITLENSKNSVKAADQTVKTAKQNLSFSVITAPFDGTIGFSQVKLGDLMNVGTTILNTVSTDDPMAVDFLINEKQLPYFEDINRGKFNRVDSLFTLLLPNSSMYPHTGRISVIDRAVDPQTGAIRVRLVFPNPASYLRAGMSCVVRVRNVDSTPQIIVPSKAVVEQMGEYFVFVVKDTVMPAKDSAAKKGENGPEEHTGLFAFQKKVMPGETIGANVIIKSGISEGDKIVVDGVQALHDGSRVSATNKPRASESGKGSSGQQSGPPGK